MDSKLVSEIFKKFRDKKVLVLGDVMIDAYVYGGVKRISPEAPVPILSIVKKEKRLGGAANVAMNLIALGAIPVLCSVVGDDLEGQEFKHLLEKEKMTSDGIIKSLNRITTVKHRMLSGTQQLLRLDSETTKPLGKLDKKALLNHINNLIQDCDLIIFEDYDKGTLDEEIIQSTISYAQKLNIPTAADPKRRNFLNYKGISIFKPNLTELKEGLKIDFDENDTQQLDEAIEKLNVIYANSKKLITLSDKGIYYQHDKEKGLHMAHLRRIADVSGAGDTVISVAGLLLTLGFSLSFIAEFSNLAGGIVCESAGVVSIDRDRLIEEATQNMKLSTLLK